LDIRGSEGLVKLSKEQRAVLVDKIGQALTQDQLMDLLPRQEQLLEIGLDRLLVNRDVEEITVEMIQGEYELITEIVAPAERILLSEALGGCK